MSNAASSSPSPTQQRTLKHSATKWVKRGFLALVVLILAYAMLFLVPIPFIAAWWSPDTDEQDSFHIQHRIADWIVMRDSLSGMTKDEVVAMLGKPVDHGYFRSFDLVYRLGRERGFISIDSEWLVVSLDDSGRVSNAQIVRD